MRRKKLAPAALWQTGEKGAPREALVFAYDAAADQYYLASGETAAAWLVYDEPTERWYASDTRVGPSKRSARVVRVGTVTRVLE